MLRRLLVVIAVGCSSPTSSAHLDGPVTAPDAARRDARASDAGPLLNVVETNEPGADWACTDRSTCIADYLAFPGKVAAQYHHPITEDQLTASLTALYTLQVPLVPGPLSAQQLSDVVRDDTNIGFLQDAIDSTQLGVATTATSETADYEERDLLFRDPYVGTFKGILLVPKVGSGPFPAVVAIHGHPDDAEIYRDNYHGHEWPSHGYAILMLTMRVMAIDSYENMAWHALIREGFSLIGMRVYETLLGFKYMRYLSVIDHDRIGLIGHSGGSSAGNLTVRIEPRFRAFVSDNQVNWFISGIEPYHCETLPALFPYNFLIDEFSTSKTPILAVPYGYANGMGEIFAFFDQWVKP